MDAFDMEGILYINYLTAFTRLESPEGSLY
jgi:hypothetical protein